MCELTSVDIWQILRVCISLVYRPHQRKRKNDSSNMSFSGSAKRLSSRPPAASPLSDVLNSKIPPPNGVTEPESGNYASRKVASPGSYLGRAEYVSGTVPIDEEDAKQYSAGHETSLPELDQKFLTDLHAFNLPARSVNDSLVAHFMERCYPWMPIVDPSDFRKTDKFEPSMLLLQAVLVAGSRVSMAPNAQVSGQNFYRRAKALFYLGHEKDPLTMVRSICILQWWNPSGPEHVSMDASSFWHHMGVALAHQIGLHREPNPKLPDAKLRRRLWWTLFVCESLFRLLRDQGN